MFMLIDRFWVELCFLGGKIDFIILGVYYRIWPNSDNLIGIPGSVSKQFNSLTDKEVDIMIYVVIVWTTVTHFDQLILKTEIFIYRRHSESHLGYDFFCYEKQIFYYFQIKELLVLMGFIGVFLSKKYFSPLFHKNQTTDRNILIWT